MNETFYITTPIYYVNASPHLGHAYTTIVADVMARYYRLKGYKTFFCTGTDEHGDKIMEAAQRARMTPKAYADHISSQFRELWRDLDLTNDYFIRTTDQDHVETVRYILQKVYDAGDIYFGNYEGHYCVGCERFYTEKELVDGLCPDHQVAPTYRKESNYFFRMSKYQDWLIKHIQDNPDFIRPERYRNEVLSFLKEPLEDLCISRPKTRLDWGITLPFDDNYVTYVWFDALINYVTALQYPTGEKFRSFWPAAQHLIAKDILKPHGIYWPTMLAAAGIKPYRHLNVHGYWNVDQGKMSKSVGNIVKPLELKDKYGLDPFRYFLLRDMVFGLDATFSEDALIQRINADLANDLGNLVSRIITMAVKFCAKRVPEPKELSHEDIKMIELADHTFLEVERNFNELAFHKALASIWEFINFTNKYIVTAEPWSLAKSPDHRDRLDRVMYQTLEALRIISLLITPFLPQTAEKIQKQLSISTEGRIDFDKAIKWGGLPPGNEIVVAPPLFPRVEKPKEEKPQVMTTQNQPFKAEIGYEEFDRIDLRVARVTAAEGVPNSRKLIKLKIDLGSEERTIVAGIGSHYQPSDLVGRLIIVLVNLRPAKIMGIESQGMLLAAEGTAGVTLLTVEKPANPGSRIK